MDGIMPPIGASAAPPMSWLRLADYATSTRSTPVRSPAVHVWWWPAGAGNILIVYDTLFMWRSAKNRFVAECPCTACFYVQMKNTVAAESLLYSANPEYRRLIVRETSKQRLHRRRALSQHSHMV
jgi:hypothetical protein